MVHKVPTSNLFNWSKLSRWLSIFRFTINLALLVETVYNRCYLFSLNANSRVTRGSMTSVVGESYLCKRGVVVQKARMSNPKNQNAMVARVAFCRIRFTEKTVSVRQFFKMDYSASFTAPSYSEVERALIWCVKYSRNSLIRHVESRQSNSVPVSQEKMWRCGNSTILSCRIINRKRERTSNVAPFSTQRPSE